MPEPFTSPNELVDRMDDEAVRLALSCIIWDVFVDTTDPGEPKWDGNLDLGADSIACIVDHAHLALLSVGGIPND